MDYIDWCLQGYITTITPITYSRGFRNIIDSLLYAMVTFESLGAAWTFAKTSITYNAQTQL